MSQIDRMIDRYIQRVGHRIERLEELRRLMVECFPPDGDAENSGNREPLDPVPNEDDGAVHHGDRAEGNIAAHPGDE